MRERNDDIHQVVVQLDRKRANLTKKYPNKWVAAGEDGVLAIEDSMEEVFAQVESACLNGSEFEVELLDPDPPD